MSMTRDEKLMLMQLHKQQRWNESVLVYDVNNFYWQNYKQTSN